MRFAVERSRTAISGRGLLRAFGRLWVILLLACGLYAGFAKGGVVHSPFFVNTEGDIEDARSDEPGLRVLFVGNSFTLYNDMPRMVHELAAEDPGAPPVFSVSRTRGSWTFEGATDDKGLDSLLAGQRRPPPEPSGVVSDRARLLRAADGPRPDPESIMAGLDPDDARYLQETAADAVAYWRYQGSEYDWWNGQAPSAPTVSAGLPTSCAKWRCAAPLADPESPICWPACTYWPATTSSSERWA
jgi:hypothetical protein